MEDGRPAARERRIRRWGWRPGSARRLLLPFFKPTRSPLWRGGLRTFVLVHPIAFEVWFRARAAWYLLARPRGESLAINWPTPGFFDRVVDHNYAYRWMFNRARTETLMNVLRCVGGISRDSRILMIGPRNEAEVLLLSLYGFRLKHVTGIDLFSYSPKIRCMDMHDMEFVDDAFDIVYVSWVLKYSYDLKKACAEIVRVVRNGGLVAVGFTRSAETSAHVGRGSELNGGVRELLDHFAGWVDHVYWQEADPVPGEAGTAKCTTIFRVMK